MIRAVWMTDIHLNFLDSGQRQAFYQDVAGQQPDVVLLSGDIAEAPTVVGCLQELAAPLGVPIYFVLGNHDFYHGSISQVRHSVQTISPDLIYLSASRVVALGGETALIGHDGWGDARNGDFAHSQVRLMDDVLIQDLARHALHKGLRVFNRRALRETLEHLGDEAAQHLAELLTEALSEFKTCVVLTHVPPFPEASWHQGRISDKDWLPFFSCAATGEVLRSFMMRHPNRSMLVLCGHTHSQGECDVLPNLKVITGAARYGRPEVQRVFEFEAE